MLSNATGILFRIPAPISQQIMAWRQQLDWQVMQYQIDNHGKVLVVRYKDDRRLQIITTTPAIGEAEVWYGNVGGGYRFTFSPQPSGCKLEIINMAGGNKRFYPDIFPPFTAHLSTSITLGALDLELLSGANDRKPNKMGEWPLRLVRLTLNYYQGRTIENLTKWVNGFLKLREIYISVCSNGNGNRRRRWPLITSLYQPRWAVALKWKSCHHRKFLM